MINYKAPVNVNIISDKQLLQVDGSSEGLANEHNLHSNEVNYEMTKKFPMETMQLVALPSQKSNPIDRNATAKLAGTTKLSISGMAMSNDAGKKGTLQAEYNGKDPTEPRRKGSSLLAQYLGDGGTKSDKKQQSEDTIEDGYQIEEIQQYRSDHRPIGIFPTKQQRIRKWNSALAPLIFRNQHRSFALPPFLDLKRMRLFAAKPHLLRSTEIALAPVETWANSSNTTNSNDIKRPLSVPPGSQLRGTKQFPNAIFADTPKRTTESSLFPWEIGVSANNSSVHPKTGKENSNKISISEMATLKPFLSMKSNKFGDDQMDVQKALLNRFHFIHSNI